VRNTGGVTSNDDEDALTWAGGRDPSHYETPEVKPPKAAKAARPAKPASAFAESSSEEDEYDELAPAMSGVVLVCLGILGGIYLLYSVGWFVSWQREIYVDPNTLELAAFRIQQVLAVLAAPLWFVTTVLVTRERKPAVRLLWLVIGALLLVPWSFTFGR
jgi:hypothetical protein